MVRDGAVALVVAVGLIASPSNRQAPIRTGAISGVVVDAVTGAPVEDAVVVLDLRDQRVQAVSRTYTDARGRFLFTDLPAGEAFRVVASAPGYFDTGYSSTPLAGGTAGTIALADGVHFNRARIALRRPAVIGGTVLDERGEPVAGVFVRLIAQFHVAGRPQVAAGTITTTDDRGMYRFASLPPGRFIVTVPSVQASVPSSFGAATIFAASSQIDAARAGLSWPLPPVAALDLDSRARAILNGYPVPPPAAGVLSFAYPAAFHGGPSITQAVVVEVSYNDVREGVDVHLSPAPTGRIAGTVRGPAEALANLTLRLMAPGMEDFGEGGEAATAAVATDGSFVFLNVPDGAYTIEAPIASYEHTLQPSMFERQALPVTPASIRPRRNGGSDSSAPLGAGFVTHTTGTAARTWWARTPVAVKATGETLVVVDMQSTVTITGHVIFEPATPGQAVTPPSFSEVSAVPATGRAHLGYASGSVEADGSFEVRGVMPASLILSASPRPGWIVKSVTAAGRDVTDSAFELSSDLSGVVVSMTKNAAELSGVVRTDQGVTSAAAVIVFPVQPEKWQDYGASPRRLKAVAASQNGAYRIPEMAAGEYFAIAVGVDRLEAWQRPEFLRAAAMKATRVTLDWGEKKSHALTLATVR